MMTRKTLFGVAALLTVLIALLALQVSGVMSQPSNDNRWAPTVVGSLPFSEVLDTTSATQAPEDPWVWCGSPYYYSGYPSATVWYSFTPEESIFVQASMAGTNYDAVMMVYNYYGSSIECSTSSTQPVEFYAEAGRNFTILIGDRSVDPYPYPYPYPYPGPSGGGGMLTFSMVQSEGPPIEASFYFWPDPPSRYDNVYFSGYAYDPAGVGIEGCNWDFGDGATATDCYTYHQYSEDGTYTVAMTATSYDGRTDTESRDVQVATHDVAITKFMTPKAAKAGQTRDITVGVQNGNFDERVRVELWRSRPGSYDDYDYMGYLIQEVPVRPANRTTDFAFSYTFTDEDAGVGKVTFRAYAQILDERDALSADNEAISKPVKVAP